MLEKWKENPWQSLAEIEIVDIRPKNELEATWQEFFVRQHYAVWKDSSSIYAFRHVRRSCEAFAMATLQNSPWRENAFPKTDDLPKLHQWLQPLLLEDEQNKFTGQPCPAFQ